MADARRRSSSKALPWITLALLALAVAAVVVPLVPYVLAVTDKGASLGTGPIEIHTSGDRTWGVYFDDRDNSGYSESCTVTDSTGRPIALRDPGMTISSSDTEMLDHVFDTPHDGRFTIACQIESADARVGPVGSLPALLIGLAAAALLGLGGLITGVLWLTHRSAARRPNAQVTGWYSNPDPGGDRLLERFWDGTAWTGQFRPALVRKEPTLSPPRYRRGVLLLLLGIIAIGLSPLLPASSNTAVPVTMTVRAPLTTAACDSGAPLEVDFEWAGRPRREHYWPDQCTRDFAVGDSVHAFAASNDPSNLGPTDRWILHPDEHDPFDLGPDWLRVTGTSAGTALCVWGIAVLGVGLRRGRRHTAAIR